MKFLELYNLLSERKDDPQKVQEISLAIQTKIETLQTTLTNLLNRVLSYSPTKTTREERLDLISELNTFFNYPPFIFLNKKDNSHAEYDPKYKKIYIYDNTLSNAFSTLKKYTYYYISRTEKGDKLNIKELGGLKNIKQTLQEKYQEFITLIQNKQTQSALFHELIHKHDDSSMKNTNLLKQAYSRGQKQQDLKYKLKEFYLNKIKTGEMNKEQAEEEYNKRLSYLINKEYFNNTGEINAFLLQVFNELSKNSNIKSFNDFMGLLEQRLDTNLEYFTKRNKQRLYKRAYQFYQNYKRNAHT